MRNSIITRMSIARAAMVVACLGVASLPVRARRPARPSSVPASASSSASPSAPVNLPSAAGQSTPAAPAGNLDAGRQVFVKKGCYACHGREGQGSPTTGPRLGPGPTSFATFTRSIRTPRAQMPPYTATVLSDAELADMYAFLQARPQPTSIDTLVPK